MQQLRSLIGREALYAQGLWFPREHLNLFSERELHDLGGNAFTSTVFMAGFISLMNVCADMAYGDEEQECCDMDVTEDAAMHHSDDEDAAEPPAKKSKSSSELDDDFPFLTFPASWRP